MKTPREIHAQLRNDLGLTSKGACELMAAWVGRSYWTVYRWIREPPDAAMVRLVNMIYDKQHQYRGNLK
jgi:hypothetical protein